MSTIHVRPATPADGRFIADSWLNSYKGAYHVKRVPSQVYWAKHRRAIAALADRSEVWVASDPLDPWTIWGWCCVEPEGSQLIVHFCYVKSALRGHRIASVLMRDVIARHDPDHIFWTHDTKQTRAFITGLHDGGYLDADIPLTYDPYLLHRSPQ